MRNLARIALAGMVLAWAAAPARAQDVTLRPGDAIRIEVKNEPNLSGQFAIGPNGDVMVPLLGVVAVADRPFATVLTDLMAGYARELAEPEFLATPLVRVRVSGEVRGPGLHWADPTLTLAEVLALAGGPLPTAKRDRAELIRDGERRRLDASPGSADLAASPHSGDALHVPRRSWVSDNLPVLVGAAASVAAAAVTSLIVR